MPFQLSTGALTASALPVARLRAHASALHPHNFQTHPLLSLRSGAARPGAGAYLLLFYNNNAKDYLQRDPYWLSAGWEVAGDAGAPPSVLWSQPEIVIYDAADHADRPGYPDFIAHQGTDGAWDSMVTVAVSGDHALRRLHLKGLREEWPDIRDSRRKQWSSSATLPPEARTSLRLTMQVGRVHHRDAEGGGAAAPHQPHAALAALAAEDPRRPPRGRGAAPRARRARPRAGTTAASLRRLRRNARRGGRARGLKRPSWWRRCPSPPASPAVALLLLTPYMRH